jgi:hypothetical protein
VAVITVAVKRSVFWDVEPCTPVKAEVSEERMASIKVEEEAKQETGMKQAASRADPEYVEDIFRRNVG